MHMNKIALFFIIFFSVFLANMASNFATAALTLTGFKQLFNEIRNEFSPPVQQLSPGLAKDIQRLKQNPIPVQQPDERISLEKQRAFENDVKLCKSWRKTFLKDGDDLSKMYMETACKRAYGN